MSKNYKRRQPINQTTRRKFLQQSGLTAAGFMIVPRYVLGGKGYVAPSDRLNLAAIGAGGKGESNIRDASGWREGGSTLENVIGLCDVDEKRAKKTFNRFSNAKQFKDYRLMLDQLGNDIDAVMVSTPDHMHAAPAMAAIKMGLDIYVEKPMTHDVFEARALTKAVNDYGVISQMGNQGSSTEDIRRICEWIWAGVIGKVEEVHCWTNRPVWEQGMHAPKEKQDVPKNLDWDLWLGTAKNRPYHESYLPFSWRGWWDFGTGALGDMACHIMDPAVRALKLGQPTAVQAFAPFTKRNWARVDSLDSPPVASMVYYEFPAREDMPPVKLTWYDGGMMPPRPEELEDHEPMGNFDGGVLFVGDKGKIMCDCYAGNPRLLPTSLMKSFEEPEQKLPRVKEENHQRNWIAAIKGDADASSDFNYAGPFTEIVLLGNLAIRSLYTQEERSSPNGKKYLAYTGEGVKLRWDGEAMKVTNYEPANQFVKREYREGWSL